MPKATSRPYLPTSLSEFALSSSSSPGASTSALTLDDPGFLLQRFRRPSLVATRHHSPLASSFTLHTRRRSHSSTRTVADDLESDKERMSTDSPSSSSGNPTPPLKTSETTDDTEHDVKTAVSKLPSTPPRRRSSSGADTTDSYFQLPMSGRRLAFPLKQPRILTLLAESHPEEIEVKSEAAFQRLISSFSELPTQPRTPRSTADRGRYPEDATHDESQREETPSDDEGPPEDTLLFSTPGGSEPVNISKTHTPSGSVNGDDFNASLSECSSFGNNLMDIDMPWASPSVSTASTPMSHWRHTPPPTSSAVRSNKRKLDDRFDPYPSASKRRAVSPSLSHLREAHCPMGSPINRNVNSRLPVAIPITIPGSAANSATSSPTIGSFTSSYPRAMSLTSSPTLRASTMGLASPILRPVARGSVSVRRGDEEREVEGAGEAVSGMTLS
ncbi:hypothetical protein AX15_001565 [Amanita polypyramis BW_CC]|nr:hypothetical protein AX15_001565 [Amanita polypyramis BW_CC]